MTQEKLAESLGMNPKSISEWERGRKPGGEARLVALARVLFKSYISRDKLIECGFTDELLQRAGLVTATSILWDEIIQLVKRIHLRARREFSPEIVMSVSGPGSMAACYYLTLHDVPLFVAVTIPWVDGGRSKQAAAFRGCTDGRWEELRTSQWSVFLPIGPDTFPRQTRILILDDYVITGETQAVVEDALGRWGYETRRSALVASNAAATSTHFIGRVLDGDFFFPWGGPGPRTLKAVLRGRSRFD